MLHQNKFLFIELELKTIFQSQKKCELLFLKLQIIF